MDYDELKQQAGFTSLHSDCSVERFDGIDIDAVLRPRLESERLKWLDEADIDLLTKADVRGVLSVASRGGATVVTLPDEYRRLLYIRLAGWSRRAEIIEHDSGDPRLARLGNEFATPGAEQPLAVRHGRNYELWPPAPAGLPPQAAISEAVAIII